MNFKKMTIKKARGLLDSGKISSVELTKEYLNNIKEKDSNIGAYLEVFEDVIEQAKEADKKISMGASSALTGIPIAVKDNILISNRIVSAASKILENYKASYDATVIGKLKKQSVVFLGRTNMDEFAMGSSTENSAFLKTRNPIDTTRVPGGSSGGSAAAVSSNMALAALGSDTAGSIRQPASFCGLVGLKPTYGRVSRFGLIAMGSSFDQIGPITKTAEDSKEILSAISGHDKRDSTSLPDDFFKKEKKKLSANKIGVPRLFLNDGVNKDLLSVFEDTLNSLSNIGYEIVDIDLPNLEYALSTYYIIVPAEISSNLSRFDGIRYGLSCDSEDIKDVYMKTRGAGFGSEVRRRILIGTFVLSSGYADEYYRNATKVREIIRKDFTEAFKKVDFIATPTTPTPAFKIGEKTDPLAMYAADIFTVPANLTGVPAISVPCGNISIDEKELPVGLQFMSNLCTEDNLFKIAEDVENLI